MSIQSEQRITRSPDVLSRVLDGEAVLLDLAAGTYFGLNDVASRIWQLVEQGITFGELRAKLLDEFDVDGATLEQDLAALIAAMLQRRLIEVSAVAEAPAL